MKIIPHNLTVIGLLIMSIQCFGAIDQTAQIDTDPFELSLRELTQIKVSVSSHYQQSIHSSPGIVRVVDRASIERNGWQDLQQVLMHIPGVQISISKNGHSNIWMRGVQNRNNNKVLLLIDGVPQHDQYYGNFHINNQVPLEHVKKIEVLNGPGGVVHGANSFSGVISISTRTQGKRIGGRLSQQNSYASSSSKEESFGHDWYVDHDWESEMGNVYIFARSLKRDGFQPKYNRRGEFYDRDTSVESQYLMAKYNHDSLNIQFNYSDYQYPYLYTKSDRWQGYDKQVISSNANYEYQINRDLKLKLNGYYKIYDFNRPKRFYDGDRIEASGQSQHDTSAQGVDATVLWPVSDHRHVSFGISYNRDWARDTFEENTDFPINLASVTTKNVSLVEDTSRNVIGVFTEYQQKILKDHWLHLGVRHDHLSDFENQSSYRISLTKESGGYYHKLLFGTSYRVPSYREYLKKYSDTYTQKNPLQPEQMQTLELAVGFPFNNHEFLMVWYSNRYQNFIKEVSINSVNSVDIASGDGDEYGFNFDQIDISGVELSWNWSVSKSLKINTQVSYIIEATEDPGTLSSNIVSPSPISSEKTNLDFLAGTTASLQINYQINSRNSLYWDAIYYSKKPVPNNYQASSSIQSAANKNGMWLSNVYLNSRPKQDILIGVGINNLFDSNIHSPNIDPATDYDNQWPKRNVALLLEWQY